MKKFIASITFTLLTIMLFAAPSNLVLTVQGTVTNESTGEPIAEHMVIIALDDTTTNNGFTQVYTNLNGNYTATIETVQDQGRLSVSTIDNCSYLMLTEEAMYSPDATTFDINFTICNDAIAGLQAEYFWNQMPDSLNNNNLIGFYDVSMGNPTSWFWDFGDGTNSEEQNPIHQYQESGEYDVCLTIANEESNETDTFCSIVYTNDTTSNCDSNIAYDMADETVFFYAETEAENAEFTWDFGDGNTGSGQEVTHTYDNEGYYYISLLTTTPTCQSRSFAEIFIGDSTNYCQAYFFYFDMNGGNWNDTTNWGDPREVINYHNDTLNTNEIAFIDVSVGNPTSWLWNFGDGTTSEEQNPIHQFTEDGTYEVCLTITNEETECESTYCETLYVNSNITGDTHQVNGTVYAGAEQLHNGFVFILGFENGFMDMMQLGNEGAYQFPNVPDGTYYIQAFPTFDSITTLEYLPTYYGNTIYWNETTAVVLGEEQNPYDIHLVSINNFTSGEANIDGILNYIGEKDPVSDISIYLMDENENVLSYAKTNNGGKFNFNDIAYGSYKLYVELMGVNSEPIAINVSETDPSINVELILKDGAVLLDIEEGQNTLLMDELYPNPVKNDVNISINSKDNQNINIIIFNEIGQVVTNLQQSVQQGNNRVRINTSALPHGIYQLIIKDQNARTLNKKFIK